MTKQRIAFAAAAALLASPAFAQSIWDTAPSANTRYYLGASGGQSKFRTDCSSLFACDTKDTGWKVYGGSGVNDVLGVELAYTDFGRIRASGVETEAWAGSISLTAGIPIGDRFKIFAKGGGVYGRTDVKASATSLLSSGDTDGWGYTWGAGAALGLTPTVQVRIDWDRYNLDFAGGSRDVDMLSAGVQLRF